MPLLDMQCRTAKPKLKPYKMFDSDGLYLEVMPSGSKYWRLKYRLHNKESRLALGIYPKVGLQEARIKMHNEKALIEKGISPALARLERKQTKAYDNDHTFKTIALEWYELNRPIWDKDYAKVILHRFEKYLFVHIGAYPIKDVKPLTILNCLQKIELTAFEMTRRMKQLCSHVFKYAIVTGRVEHDPTYGLECALKKYKRGHFASISVDELPEFLQKLSSYEPRLNRQTYLAIRLMLLTFVRTSELIKAKWEEINFEKALWIIPAERMKMKREHIVPLSTQSLGILQELKAANSKSEYVFPNRNKSGKKYMSNGVILVALGRMGYKKRMTGHGFRSLALGILKEKLEYPHDIADRQLAHSPKNSVNRAYDRALFLDKRCKMMQAYADYIDSETKNVFKALQLAICATY